MDSSPQHLLSEPNKQNEQFSKIFKRPDCSYESHWGRFKVTRREFSQQYAHMYFVRLSEMRDKLKERAKQKWGKESWSVCSQFAKKIFILVCIFSFDDCIVYVFNLCVCLCAYVRY